MTLGGGFAGGGGRLRGAGGSGARGTGGGDAFGGRGALLGSQGIGNCALARSICKLGFLPAPVCPMPTFLDPMFLLPQSEVPVLLTPKLAVPWFPTPKLFDPALPRPTLPLLSGVHLDAPAGTHSTAIRYWQDGHEQLVLLSRSTPETTPPKVSRVACRYLPALKNPRDLHATSQFCYVQNGALC